MDEYVENLQEHSSNLFYKWIKSAALIIISFPGVIHLVRTQNFPKTNISYPLIRTLGKFCVLTKWMTPYSEPLSFLSSSHQRQILRWSTLILQIIKPINKVIH